MKILVSYFSHTGHTKGIAEAIARELGADIERIEEVEDRTGAWGYLGASRDAIFKRPASLKPIEKDPAEYDLVILGTPIWAWNLSPPMRAYISEHKRRFNQVAFFCTEGASGGQRAFRQMVEIIGKRSVETLEITEHDLKTGADKNKLKPFFEAIAKWSDGIHAGTPAQPDS